MAVQGATVDVSTTAVALNVADSDGVQGQTLLVRHLDADDVDVHSWAPPPSSTGYSPPANSHNYQP